MIKIRVFIRQYQVDMTLVQGWSAIQNWCKVGGESEIRTHGTVARTTVFETVPFNPAYRQAIAVRLSGSETLDSTEP